MRVDNLSAAAIAALRELAPLADRGLIELEEMPNGRVEVFLTPQGAAELLAEQLLRADDAGSAE